MEDKASKIEFKKLCIALVVVLVVVVSFIYFICSFCDLSIIGKDKSKKNDSIATYNGLIHCRIDSIQLIKHDSVINLKIK